MGSPKSFVPDAPGSFVADAPSSFVPDDQGPDLSSGLHAGGPKMPDAAPEPEGLTDTGMSSVPPQDPLGQLVGDAMRESRMTASYGPNHDPEVMARMDRKRADMALPVPQRLLKMGADAIGAVGVGIASPLLQQGNYSFDYTTGLIPGVPGNHIDVRAGLPQSVQKKISALEEDYPGSVAAGSAVDITSPAIPGMVKRAATSAKISKAMATKMPEMAVRAVQSLDEVPKGFVPHAAQLSKRGGVEGVELLMDPSLGGTDNVFWVPIRDKSEARALKNRAMMEGWTWNDLTAGPVDQRRNPVNRRIYDLLGERPETAPVAPVKAAPEPANGPASVAAGPRALRGEKRAPTPDSMKAEFEAARKDVENSVRGRQEPLFGQAANEDVPYTDRLPPMTEKDPDVFYGIRDQSFIGAAANEVPEYEQWFQQVNQAVGKSELVPGLSPADKLGVWLDEAKVVDMMHQAGVAPKQAAMAIRGRRAMLNAAQDAQASHAGKVVAGYAPDLVNPQTGQMLAAGGGGGMPPNGGGGGMGPGGTIPPVPPASMTKIQQARARFDTWMNEGDPYKRNIIARTLFAPGVLGHPDVAAIGRELAASKAMTEKWQDYFDALGGYKGPKQAFDAEGKARAATRKEWFEDVQKLATGAVDDAYMTGKYRDEWMRRKQVYMDALNYRSQLHRQLVAMGAVPENPEFLDPNGHVTYLARTYMAFGDKKWGLRAPGEAIEAGAAVIAKLDPSKTAEEIAHDIASYMDDGKTFEQMLADPKNSWGEPMKRLMKRGDVPEGIRAMLGEIQGPAALATTIAHQESLLNQFRIMNEIAGNDAFSTMDKARAINLRWKQLPPDRRYGNLAGKWVRPDLIDIIDHNSFSKAKSGWMWVMQSLWKKNVILGKFPAAVTHQTMREFMHAINSGGVDLFRPDELLKGIGKTEKSLRAYFGSLATRTKANPFSEEAKLVQLASQYGAWEQSANRLELRSTHLEMARTMAGSMKLARGTDLQRGLETMSRLYDKLTRPGSALYNKAGEAWQLTTNYWRLVSFSNRFDHYKGIMKDGVRVFSDHAAARAAAQDVADAFTSTQNLSATMDKIRKGGVGVANPFMADDIEELTRLPYRMYERMKADPEYRARIMANYAIIGSGISAASLWSMNHYDIGPDDLKRGKAAFNASGQSYFRPGAFIVKRDERGNLVAKDFTWFHNAARMFQGDPAHLPGNLVTNFLTTPIQGGLLENTVREGIENLTGVPAPPEFQTPEAHKTWQNAIWVANRAGLLGPTAIAAAYDYMRSLGFGPHYGRWSIPKTPEQAAAGLVGTGVEIPIGEKTEKGYLRGNKGEQRDLKQQIKSERRAKDVEGAQRVKDKLKEVRQERKKFQKDRQAAPDAYRKVKNEE